MTLPGPCMYHCGSRVGVSVIVNVGRGVSDGVGVEVVGGKKIGVRVAVCVGEGSGLMVRVGSSIIVGEGSTINVNPPHPSNSRVAPVIERKIFCKFCYNGWLRSQRMRKPSRVSQGAMIWITSVS